MIQLYEINENKKFTVQVLSDGDTVFFKARDVFDVLGLKWRNTAISLVARKVKKENIRKGEELLPVDSPKAHGNLAVYISESSVYQLAFRSNKKEAAEFTDWAANVIVQIRKTGKFELAGGEGIDIKKHCDTDVQKDNSKKINAKNFEAGGTDQVRAYNRKNCQLHAGGMTPSEVKAFGKKKGLKSKDTSSAKQVIRKLKPELAAGMSFTDGLVHDNGVDHEKAVAVSLEHAVPLFQKLMELGIKEDKLID